ncbi:MAG: alpha/beta hydrolase fold domain-containing protein [Armatimonadota bacterium]
MRDTWLWCGVLISLSVSVVCIAFAAPTKPAQEFMQKSPRVGDAAPGFELKDVDGKTHSLTDLYAQKPVVIVFGSLSCPVYRSKIVSCRKLAEMMGDRARYVMIYTVEAHPQDTKSPYADRVWLHRTNEEQGVLINQPTTYEERLALAKQASSRMGDDWIVLVDEMDNAVWEAYGRRPNSAFVIGADGNVQVKQLWAQPRGLVQYLRPQQPGLHRRPPVPDGVETEYDIVYAEPDSIPQKLDAYWLPEGDPHPAVVFIHGGGWRSGDKAGYGPEALRFCEHNVAGFSLNYRLSNVAPYPAAVDDCLAAIRFIRASAERFNIDPDRLALQGGSAGGHLALMMNFLEPDETDTNADGEPLENFAVCCVAKNPPTDFPAMWEIKQERGMIAFLGGEYPQVPDIYREASPITHLSADDPPVLMMHGTADRTVPYSQATLLKSAMNEAGVPCELKTFEGAGHGLKDADRQAVQEVREYALKWILSHLGVEIPQQQQ